MLSVFQQKTLESLRAGIEPNWAAVCDLLRFEFQGAISTVVLIHKLGGTEVLAESGAVMAQVRPYREANWNGTASTDLNPFLAEAVRHREPGSNSVVSAADLLVSNDVVRQTTFYKNHMAASGINDAVGALLFDGELLLGKISVVRNSIKQRFGPADAEKFRSITDYLLKGLHRSRAVRELRWRAAAGEESLSERGFGLLIFRPDGKLLFSEGRKREFPNLYEQRIVSAVKALAIERNLTDSSVGSFVQAKALGSVSGDLGQSESGPNLRFRLVVCRIFSRNRIFCYIFSGAPVPRPIYAIPSGVELTRREREVVEFLIQGADNGSISKRMGIGVYTVKDHLKSIFQKLNVHTRAGAVALLTRGMRPNELQAKIQN
ncbi:MAG: helix-turn-helix transcriptional regulator [Planctomycetes bacterium]|nr:helix-turn-helix transcriptional regulator [Planctomycetota bacterium]